MKKIFILLLICGVSSVSFAQEVTKKNSVDSSNTNMKEIVVKTEALRNFEGKVFEMDYYYGCKFSKEDERLAVIDGYILLDFAKIDELRKWVARQHNVQELDVIFISGKENSTYGSFEVCIAGMIYEYVKRGRDYLCERKSKPLTKKRKWRI